jgi:8-oxo-dGTP pyrophosphatase MutT (NUDIX family)
VNREDLRTSFDTSAASNPEEAEALERVRLFLSAPADPFARDNPEGHVTGSAVVARPDGSAFLLVYHRKLGRWLQPGGHTEASDASAFETARREVREETGISELHAPFSGAILDVDVHAIPAHGKDAAHLHFDIRYLLTSDEASHAENAEDPARPMRWIRLEEAHTLGVDGSLARALEKARRRLSDGGEATGSAESA